MLSSVLQYLWFGCHILMGAPMTYSLHMYTYSMGLPTTIRCASSCSSGPRGQCGARGALPPPQFMQVYFLMRGVLFLEPGASFT